MSNPAFERVLVTGGTGFIGRYVVDLLESDGIHPLITTFSENPKNQHQGQRDSDIVEVDLTDATKVNELIKSDRPQTVLHLAGVTGHNDPSGRIYHEINFNGTVNLLNALNKNGVDRVILLGTAAEYGDQPVPFREDMPARPVSHYAVSKAMANQFALDMYSQSGLPIVILRVFTAYGYWQPDKMFLSQLIRHGLLNRHFKMSDGLQKRDFVYVEDAAKAIKASMTAENIVGRIINIAGGQGIALRDLAQKAWNICGADTDRLEIGSLEKAGDDGFDTEADISLAEKILNWRPGPGILSETGDNFRLQETIQKMKGDAKTFAGK